MPETESESLTPSYLDAINNFPHVRLQRVVRGVVCEVWVGERGELDGYYSTVEVLFAHPKWTVEVEVLNLEKRVPLGVITHATQNVSDTSQPSTRRPTWLLIKGHLWSFGNCSCSFSYLHAALRIDDRWEV